MVQRGEAWKTIPVRCRSFGIANQRQAPKVFAVFCRIKPGAQSHWPREQNCGSHSEDGEFIPRSASIGPASRLFIHPADLLEKKSRSRLITSGLDLVDPGHLHWSRF